MSLSVMFVRQPKYYTYRSHDLLYGSKSALRFELGLYHYGSTQKSEIEFQIEPQQSCLP